jgi:hypothetical protein
VSSVKSQLPRTPFIGGWQRETVVSSRWSAMKRRFGLVIVVLISASSPVFAQQTFADANLYVAVVNRLFQHEVRHGAPETLLRYTFCGIGLPNSCRELQILVLDTNGGQLVVQMWYVPQSSPDIWDQLAALTTKTPDITAEKAASLINIQQETKTISKSARLWNLLQKAHLPSAPLTVDNSLTVDGSEYHFEVHSLSEELSITLQGPPPEKASEAKSPIVRWMAQVRNEVERNVITQNPAKP